MEMLDAWTGRTACALQKAFRLSNELFAKKLNVSVRTVGAWHQKPELHPKSGIQQMLDATLEVVPAEAFVAAMLAGGVARQWIR
jgi:DNA-binding transcriptional regulator YiaG